MFVEQGIIRFGLLNYYKNIEDAQRQDSTEGHGSLHVLGIVKTIDISRVTGDVVDVRKEPGHIHLHAHRGNPIYILSCIFPPDNDISCITSKFGDYIVRINDPKRLGQEITNKRRENSENRTPIECVKVLYNKGHQINEELDRNTRSKLAFSQKPSNFKDEYEFRLVAINDGIIDEEGEMTEEFMRIELGRPITYAELLD